MNKTYWSIDIDGQLNIFIEVIKDVVFINTLDKETLTVKCIAVIELKDKK